MARRCTPLLALLLILIAPLSLRADDNATKARADALRGCLGTYGSPPRRADKHVDIPLLLEQLKDLGANSYNWLVWSENTDWDDLQTFLPKAREQGLKVWVTLVPPSESPPKTKKYSEPFRTDYDKWAVEIAKLSAQQPNLVAWSIDDFAYNVSVFTPDHTRQMLAAAHEINPKLAFIPVVYWGQLKPKLSDYRGLFDGVLYPYRHDSVKQNLTEMGTVKPEVAKVRQLLGEDIVVIVDVYQTKHSRAGSSTPQYVRDVIAEARAVSDGIMIYTHPNPKTESEKYQAVRDRFHESAK